MKRTFCDGCDEEIYFNSENQPTMNARVDLRVNFYCVSGVTELGQFASDRMDLCSRCIENMKSLINPANWTRAARAA